MNILGIDTPLLDIMRILPIHKGISKTITATIGDCEGTALIHLKPMTIALRILRIHDRHGLCNLRTIDPFHWRKNRAKIERANYAKLLDAQGERTGEFVANLELRPICSGKKSIDHRQEGLALRGLDRAT